MLKVIFVVIFAILIYVVISPVILCWALPIGHFHTPNAKTFVAQLPIDSEPTVYGSYYPTVSFRSGQFMEGHSDFIITGSYDCKAGQIVARPSVIGIPNSVGYIPIPGILVWNGEFYQNTVQLLLLAGVSVVLVIREIFRRWV